MKPRQCSRVVWLDAVTIGGKPEPSTMALTPGQERLTILIASDFGITVERPPHRILVPWSNVKWAEVSDG